MKEPVLEWLEKIENELKETEQLTIAEEVKQVRWHLQKRLSNLVEAPVMPNFAEQTLNKIAPFLARLIKPRLDKYETDEYVNGSSDCKRALEAFEKYRESKISV